MRSMRVCPRCHALYVREVSCCGLDGELLVDVDRDPLIGRSVDRYRVLDLLGGGGMARVYRAEHEGLGQLVALKVLSGELAQDRRIAERFRREARAAAQIHHRNVVEVRDFGVTEGGLAYIAMELLEGRTLSDRLREQERFSPAHIADLIRQTALGLSAAHKLGFVHRDLKPKNLMSVPAGTKERVKILDFGLVRIEAEGEARLTAHGQVFGTPAYMAPEQVLDAAVDARADLYALGVILYELLAGHRPFGGSLGEVIEQQVQAAPPRLEDRTGLGELALALLAKDPSARPRSAERVIEAVDALELSAGHKKARRPRAARADEVTTPIRPRKKRPLQAVEDEAESLAAMARLAKPVWATRIAALALLTLVGVIAYPRYASYAAKAAAQVTPMEAAPSPGPSAAAVAAPASSPPAAKPAPRQRAPSARQLALLPRKPERPEAVPIRDETPDEDEETLQALPPIPAPTPPARTASAAAPELRPVTPTPPRALIVAPVASATTSTVGRRPE